MVLITLLGIVFQILFLTPSFNKEYQLNSIRNTAILTISKIDRLGGQGSTNVDILVQYYCITYRITTICTCRIITNEPKRLKIENITLAYTSKKPTEQHKLRNKHTHTAIEDITRQQYISINSQRSCTYYISYNRSRRPCIGNIYYTVDSSNIVLKVLISPV